MAEATSLVKQNVMFSDVDYTLHGLLRKTASARKIMPAKTLACVLMCVLAISVSVCKLKNSAACMARDQQPSQRAQSQTRTQEQLWQRQRDVDRHFSQGYRKKHDRCKPYGNRLVLSTPWTFWSSSRRRGSTSGHRKLRDLRQAFGRLLVRKTCGGWNDAPANGANARRL